MKPVVMNCSSRRGSLRHAVFPLLLLLVQPAVVQAEYLYETSNGEITITGYIGTVPGGAMVIPGTIDGLPVTRIGDHAFEYQYIFASVTIPNSVTSIGNNAFYGWSGLISIAIPNSVTNIGVQAFATCLGLGSITVDASNPFYCSVDGVLFNESRTTLIQYPPGKSGSDYTIPGSVTCIGSSAFYGSSSLTNIAIPNSVISIGDKTSCSASA